MRAVSLRHDARVPLPLRAFVGLCLALLGHGAIPHLHHAHERPAALAAATEAPAAVASGATAPSQLSADDHHETHSSRNQAEQSPCTLCRERSARELATVPAPPPLPEAIDAAPPIPAPTTLRAELLFARRHPARGPPAA